MDSIVDELEKDEHIKQLYNLWYAEKDKIVSNYTNEKLKRNPLSQNKEFKSIRNMIIRQALQLDDLVMAFDDDETDEPFIFSEDETEFEPPDDIPDEYYSLNSFEKYRLAKEFLDETSVEYNPERGLSLMWEAAEDGNSFAQYRLGKILVQGIICEKILLQAYIGLKSRQTKITNGQNTISASNILVTEILKGTASGQYIY